MEEDRIKDIFREYDPELSSSIAFMERLERNLNAVELIHRENAAAMKRNKRAVTMAACAGFATGIIFTLILPYLTDLIHSVLVSFIGFAGEQDITGYSQVISWLIIGAFSVFIALDTYEITLNHRSLRGGKQED